MIPNDSSKSNYPKLPVAYTNGHKNMPSPATLSGGSVYVEPESPASAAPEGGDVAILRALRRCWPVAALLGLLAGAAVGGATWYFWPAKYTAQAVIHVPPRPGVYGEDLQQHVRTQSAKFKNRKVIEEALREPEVVRLSLVQDDLDPVAVVEKNLLIDANLGPEILRAHLSGDRPEEVRDILNAMVKVFVKEVGHSELSAFDTKMKQLLDKKEEYEKLLRAKRVTLQGLEDRYGTEALQTATQRAERINQQIDLLKRDLTQTQVDLKVAVTELAVLTAQGPTEAAAGLSEAAVEDYLRQDARYQQMQTDLLKLEQDAARLREVATEEGLRAQMESLAGRRAILEKARADRRKEVQPLVEKLTRGRSLEAARETRTKLEARKAGLEERERQLRAQLEKLQATAREPGHRLPAVDEVRDSVASLESGLKKINEQIDGLKIDSPLAARISVLEPASLPKTRNSERQTKMTGAAALGAFGLLFAGVFWREVRTRRVYGARDVANHLGTHLLGTLPVLPVRARRALPTTAESENSWQQVLGESVDAIRTQLLRASQTEGLKVVLVTSAVGGEGKTSLATHLAVSLARAWRKTLLIDGDLRKPGIHEQFNQNNEPGFCDVLRGDLDFSDVVRPTPVSRLWIAPAGQADAHALQALSQDTVGRSFEAAREQYDFILIDSSPVLPVADTLSLGQHADGVIFAVLRDVSRYPAIQAAQQRLAALDIRLLGTVVIGANEDPASLGYSVGDRTRPTVRA